LLLLATLIIMFYIYIFTLHYILSGSLFETVYKFQLHQQTFNMFCG